MDIGLGVFTVINGEDESKNAEEEITASSHEYETLKQIKGTKKEVVIEWTRQKVKTIVANIQPKVPRALLSSKMRNIYNSLYMEYKIWF